MHIISQCEAYEETRSRILNQIKELFAETNFNLEKIFENNEHLTQFILDPTSINLPHRIDKSDTVINELLRLSRDYCFAISSARSKILIEKTKKTQ